MTDVEVAASVIDSQKRYIDRDACWMVKARVISILSERPHMSIERESWFSILKITGTLLHLFYDGPRLPHMSLKPGILFRVKLPFEAAHKALEDFSNGMEPELRVEPRHLRPMKEPCVRVPLSILKELRGQEAGTEYSRRALVQVWSEDRKTGKKNPST